MRIFLPSILPSHLMPLMLSPLTLMSSPLFVRLPLLCLPLLRWLLSPPLALGSSFLRSLYCLYSFSPFLGVSAGCGWFSALGSAPMVAPAPPGFPPFLILLLFCLRLLLRFLLLLYLLPGLRVSRCFSLAFGSLSVACLFRACLGLISGGSGISQLLYGPPTSLLHPSSCLCPPVLSAASALPLFCSAPQGSSAGSSGFASSSTVSALALVAPLLSLVLLLLSSAVWGFCGSFCPPLCLVTVLLSLCSWFVGPDAPGAAAPVPETLVPHLVTASARAVVRLLYRYLVALPLAAGSSQAPLPPCSLFVEFLLLLLLVVVLSFCLGLSVYAPHSRWLPLAVFLCWLVVVQGPPFCLLVCLRVLLGAVLLGFYGSGCSFMAG